jgi:hypothetical protein
MPNDFQRAAGNSTTTARELTNELERFANDLKDTANKLGTELTEMRQAQTDISEELVSAAKSFLDNTLTELYGNEFDTIAEIAQNLESLGTQGLTFFRNSLIEKRDSALANINKTLDHTIDIAKFNTILAEAQQAFDDACTKASNAHSELDQAQQDLKEWEDNTVEDDLVRLDQDIREKGGVNLNTDNKSAFADLTNFREKYDNFNAAILAAETNYESANSEKSKAENLIGKLSLAADQIKTNEEILETVQNKLVKDLKSSPDFIIAMAEHYEEDFPRKLPLLFAKLNLLSKLEAGTSDKLETVQNRYKETSLQYSKMSQLRPNQRIKGDLEAIQKHNKATTSEFKRYGIAARDSWRRTRDYEWNLNTNGSADANNGPNHLETLLIYNMLSDNDSHYDHVPSKKEFHADENSRFVADLAGIDQETGKNIGLPSDTFKFSESGSQNSNGPDIDNQGKGPSTNRSNNKRPSPSI